MRRLMIPAMLLVGLAVCATGAWALNPSSETFDYVDGDGYQPADANPFDDPPTGTSPAFWIGQGEFRSDGVSGLIEEVLSGKNGIISANGSIGHAEFYPQYIFGFDTFHRNGGSVIATPFSFPYSFKMDIYMDPSWVGRSIGGGALAEDDWWVNQGVNDATNSGAGANGTYLSEGSLRFNLTDNAPTDGVWEFAFHTGPGGPIGSLFKTATPGWYTFEQIVDVGPDGPDAGTDPDILFTHRVWDVSRKTLLSNPNTFPSYNSANGSNLGGDRFSAFFFVHPNVAPFIAIDNVSVGPPIGTSDIGIVSVCAATPDPNKVCTNTVFTNQPWHVMFEVRNKGQSNLTNWSYDVELVNQNTMQTIPVKTQVPGPTVPMSNPSVTINQAMQPFNVADKGPWQVNVRVEVKDTGNPEPPSLQDNNFASATMTVQNKPFSDIGVVSVCAASPSPKQCISTVFTNQPWHTMFTVRNKGKTDVVDWSYNIILTNQSTMQTIPVKTQNPGPVPLPQGGQPVTINWPMPTFDAADKGNWSVGVRVQVKGAEDPDVLQDNNFASAPLTVVNKPFSDIGVFAVCAATAGRIKECISTVNTNQPWHTMFSVRNKGKTDVTDWSYDIIVTNPTTMEVRPIKQQNPGPQPLPQGGEPITVNWAMPPFDAADKGDWVVGVRVAVKESNNPDNMQDNNFASATMTVVNKPFSDIGVVTVCAATPEPNKECTNIVFTQQPWHTMFVVQNKGKTNVTDWSYDITLINPTTLETRPVKTQIGGPAPLPRGGDPVTVNWPMPLFDIADKGAWQVAVAVEVKEAGNPDNMAGNNIASGTLVVANKPLSDIGLSAVCVTHRIDKACTDIVFAEQPWNIVFTVVNKGQKAVTDWSFDIDLIRQATGQRTVLKAQVAGAPLPVGGSQTINWPSPLEFTPAQVETWDVEVRVDVKEPTNPDLSQTNNTRQAKFDVVEKPTATQLTLFQGTAVDEGLEIRWQFGEPAGLERVTLERSEATSGPWSEMGAERRQEGEVTVALDRSPLPSTTYYYRLVARTQGGELLTFGPLAVTSGAGVKEFELTKLAPNPSAGAVGLEFTVPREAQVRLSVLDVQGREVAVLASGLYRPGRYQASWSGETASGRAPAGIYFVRYQTPERSFVRRLARSR